MCNCQKLKAIQMPYNGGTLNQATKHPYHRLVLSEKNKPLIETKVWIGQFQEILYPLNLLMSNYQNDSTYGEQIRSY